MQSSEPKYVVTLQTAPELQLGKERRFIVAEKDFVKRQLVALGNRIWPFFSYPGLNIFRPIDWKRYDHALDEYGRELDKHEKGLKEEFLPFHLYVSNLSDEDDKTIKIHVTVDGGMVSDKKPPKRPKRIDGSKPTEKVPFALPHLNGFMRKGIKIADESIDVEFSRLDAHDSAELVRKVLYLHGDPNTRMHYEIRSRGLSQPERGEVLL